MIRIPRLSRKPPENGGTGGPEFGLELSDFRAFLKENATKIVGIGHNLTQGSPFCAFLRSRGYDEPIESDDGKLTYLDQDNNIREVMLSRGLLVFSAMLPDKNITGFEALEILDSALDNLS